MIRILHSIDTTGPGGAETVFVNLATGLDPHKFKSFAVIKGEGWVCDTLRSHGIEPIFVKAKGSFNLRYLFELVRVVRHYKIDVIQSHLLGSNLYCCLAGIICRIPVFSTFHGFVDAQSHERFMGLKTWMINQGSKKIVFVSECLKRQFQQAYGFWESKSITIYNGVDTEVFYPKRDTSIRRQLGLSNGNILIGAVGNIRPAKGYDLFLKAARIIYDKHPDCRFVVAGQGSGQLYQSLLELRKKLHLEDVFFFLGFQHDTALFLNNLDIFCLPSTSEGFSISTIEAMACGIPVVATRCGGPEEIIVHETSGLLSACDSYALASNVAKLIDCPNLGYMMIRDAMHIVKKQFSLAAMQKKYEHNWQIKN